MYKADVSLIVLRRKKCNHMKRLCLFVGLSYADGKVTNLQDNQRDSASFNEHKRYPLFGLKNPKLFTNNETNLCTRSPCSVYYETTTFILLSQNR